MTITTNPQEFQLGIDVGKKDLFCYLIGNEKSFSDRFDNSESGITRLIKWVTKMSNKCIVHTCMEATGHYTRLVSKMLYNTFNGDLYVVNPRQIKAFANRRLRRNKSDKADAKIIAQFLISEHTELIKFIPKTD